MGLEILSITDPSKAQIKRACNFKNMARKVVAGGAMAAATLGMGACGGAPNDPGSITGPAPQSAIEQKFLGSYINVLAPDSNLTSAPTTISLTEDGDGTIKQVKTLNKEKSTNGSLVYDVDETDGVTGAVGKSTETYTVGPDEKLKVNIKSPDIINTYKNGMDSTLTAEDGFVKMHNDTTNRELSWYKKLKKGVIGVFNSSGVKEGEQTDVKINGNLISNLFDRVKDLFRGTKGDASIVLAKATTEKAIGTMSHIV